ncbi:MAG: flagellar hook-length control protein FliK, partial [Desulfamplus sp.]
VSAGDKSVSVEEAKLDKILTNENAQAAKELKELLASLGITIKSKSDLKDSDSTLKPYIKDIKNSSELGFVNSENLTVKSKNDKSLDINAHTEISQTNKLNLKNSSEFFNEISQKKVINNAEIEKEQKSKIESVTNSGTSGSNISFAAGVTGVSSEAGTGNIIVDQINLAHNSESLVSGKKSERNSRSNVNESGSDSIISRLERKESITVSDSNNSSDKNFFNQNDNRGTSLGAAANKSVSSVLPSYVTNQVVRSINRAITSGENEIRLQLRPAELGRIFMTIETVGDTLNVSIVAENQSAKDILTGHTNDLKSSLANNGITIGNFDVEVGSDFKQSMADSGQQFQSGSDSGRNNSSSGQRSSISTDEIEGVQTILNNEDGNLHFVA